MATFDKPPWLEPRPDGLALRIYVQPGAKKTAVRGEHGDCLKIAVAAPAQDDKANTALVEFVAERLEIAKSLISIASGEKSRIKRLIVSIEIPANIVVARLLC
jgi:uncharacterized protein